ncbi:MAG: hypothetical protein JWL81_615 [Verrucomicrobiales bacterium]|nr:hypothetical protein [Verrucomicrobiales bacterium]
MKFPRFHPKAWEEFNSALRYYAVNAGSKVTQQFEQCFYESLKSIQAAPLLYRQRENGIRRVNLEAPFTEWYIAYLLDTAVPLVVALGHAKRMPHYFLNRLGDAGNPEWL